MTILIVLATILLILDCLLLCLLVLVQLPKKEAGLGMAFGGGAADALFGAGSGTALSQLTKYTTIAFFVLVFALSVMNNHAQNSHESELKGALESLPAVATPPAGALKTGPTTAKPAQSTPAIPLTISTNTAAPAAPAAPATNK